MDAAKTFSPAIPRRRSIADEIIVILVGAAAVAASARVAIHIGPVPITLQTLAVLLVGALLGPVRGTASILVYLSAGSAAPVLFANPLGLAGPTGGYLIGFIPAACLTGMLFDRGWGRSRALMLAALIISTAAVYAVGLPWLAMYPRMFLGLAPMSVQKVLAVGFYPFLPGAALKIALAAIAITRLRSSS